MRTFAELQPAFPLILLLGTHLALVNVLAFAPCKRAPVGIHPLEEKSASRLVLYSFPPNIDGPQLYVLGDDEDYGDDEEDEDEEEEELVEDPYTKIASEEFREKDGASSSALTFPSPNGELTTIEDWGGALGKLRERVEDVQSGMSQNPSHALFRLMSSETPNQVIGKFVQSANPQTVQAMSGAVSSLLGGTSRYSKNHLGQFQSYLVISDFHVCCQDCPIPRWELKHLLRLAVKRLALFAFSFR